MATITFRLKSKTTKRSTIYCRFSKGKFLRQEFKTKLSIEPILWNVSKGLPKKNKEECKDILLHLKKLELFLYSEYFKESLAEIISTDKWLQTKINLFEENITERAIRVIEHVDYIILTAPSRANQKGSVGLSIGRIKSYVTFKSMLISYEVSLKKKNIF